MKRIRTELCVVVFVTIVLTSLSAVRPGLADITYNDGGTYNINTSMPAGAIYLNGGTTLNVLSGGNITGGNGGFNYGVNASNSSPVNVYGGTINGGNGGFNYGVNASNSSPVNVYGGTINGTITGDNESFGYGIYAYGSSPVNVYGGTITGAITGGIEDLGYGISADYSSVVNIYGGTIRGGNAGASCGIDAAYSSIVNIYGGTISGANGITSDYGSQVNVHGGNIGGLIEALYGSTVDIYGSGFNYKFGQISATSGNITGTLSDGTPINVAFDNFGEGNIILSPTPTPIPTAAYLFGSGLLGLLGIRKKMQQ